MKKTKRDSNCSVFGERSIKGIVTPSYYLPFLPNDPTLIFTPRVRLLLNPNQVSYAEDKVFAQISGALESELL
jgi:hypothetical protein